MKRGCTQVGWQACRGAAGSRASSAVHRHRRHAGRRHHASGGPPTVQALDPFETRLRKCHFALLVAQREPERRRRSSAASAAPARFQPLQAPRGPSQTRKSHPAFSSVPLSRSHPQVCGHAPSAARRRRSKPLSGSAPVKRAGHRCRACRNARAGACYWSTPEILVAERERARRNERLRRQGIRASVTAS